MLISLELLNLLTVLQMGLSGVYGIKGCMEVRRDYSLHWSGAGSGTCGTRAGMGVGWVRGCMEVGKD